MRKKKTKKQVETFETLGQNLLKNSKLALLGAMSVYIAHNYSPAIESTIHRLAVDRGYTIADPLDTMDGIEAAAIACAEIDLDPNLCRSVARIESGGDHSRVSNRGAVGLMQVMSATARKLCINADLYRQSDNARCGAAILAYELDRHNDKLDHALQAYNGGPKCVGKCSESVKYSKLVRSDYKRS